MKKLLLALLMLLLCLPALAETNELSGYTILDGWRSEQTAMYLARNLDGVLVFLGYMHGTDGNEITISTPLPEGATCDTASAQDGCIRLYIPLAEGTLPVTVAYEDDGAWRVTGLWFSYVLPVRVQDNGYYFRWQGAFYGDLPFDRDVTAIDWLALPQNEENALAGLDVSQWRILREDTALLRLNDLQPDEFRAGTPVRVVTEDDAGVTVAILGGDALYTAPAEALLPGDVQFGEDTGLVSQVYPFPGIEVTEDTPLLTLYVAPDGAAAGMVSAVETDFLAFLTVDPVDGWLYVADFVTGVHGWLRVADLPADEPFVMAQRLLPEYRFVQGDLDEENCCFLVECKSDGAVLFAGCTLVAGEWAVTLSEPLPEGAGLDTFHGSGDYAILSYNDAETSLMSIDIFGEEMPWKTCVLTPDGQGGWRVEAIGNDWSAFSVSRCTLRNNYGSLLWWCTPGFDTNLATLRWDALPDTLEEALALSDVSDWVVLTQDTPLMNAPEGVPIGMYCAGAGLRVLAEADGWLQVAVADGAVTGYVPADAVIPSAENYAVDEDGWGESLYMPSYVALRRDEPAVQLYGADGAVLHTFDTRGYKAVRLLGERDDYYHIYDYDTGLDGFILKSEVRDE